LIVIYIVHHSPSINKFVLFILYLLGTNALNQNLPRDDYKEFLELVIIFLGGVPPKSIHFQRPGAYHLARWMCKGIYCLKLYIFQEQFNMTKAEISSLKTICCFILKCYIEFWFRSPNAIEAPYNDIILFLKNLKNINPMISKWLS